MDDTWLTLKAQERQELGVRSRGGGTVSRASGWKNMVAVEDGAEGNNWLNVYSRAQEGFSSSIHQDVKC